jgi:signal transduction histidine kinase
MRVSPPEFHQASNNHLLVAYIAELELEVDRLRKERQYVHHAFGEELNRVKRALDVGSLPADPSATVCRALVELAEVIQDLEDPPGCQPSRDEVTEIPVRPLVEHVFRWQQRQSGASRATLRLELSAESIKWFPARFRHILDNLISNALKYRDPDKGETRVTVLLNHRGEMIELRVTDNGLGIHCDESTTASDFLNRSAYRRSPGLGVGLSVVKLLIEQSGGSLSVDSCEGKGSNFTAVLPRYESGDYLT